MNKKAMIFLILFVLSFFASLFACFNKIKIPYFNGLHKDVQVDVIFKNESPRVFYNNEENKNILKIDDNHYLFLLKECKLIKNISFDNVENIEKLIIYNGNEAKFFKEIPKEISIDNTKNILDKAVIAFLSFFYNCQYYFVAYIFLFLFLYNYKSDLKPKNIIISLIFLGFILRLAQINYIPFWDDEIYVLASSALDAKLIELFQDPGNPPLYFILFKIYRIIVQNPDFYRFSSVILGILFNICFYIYLKIFLGSKRSLVGLFIATINIALIYFSQEIRCYMLLMLLAVINSYFLFRFNKKTKIGYLISAIAILYTHFYASFLIFYNFIVGLILFRNKEKFKSFLTINIITFFSFLPLLIYKKQSIVSDFNSWMKPPTIFDVLGVIDIFMGKIIFCVLFILLCFYVYKKSNKKREKLLISYNFSLIIFLIFMAFVFSYLIKPIFHYKYFYIAYPSYLALLSVIILYFYKTKFKTILPILILLMFTIYSKVSYQNLFCNHSLYIDFIKHDIDKTKDNYIFMTDTVEKYKEFKISKNQIYLPVNKGMDSIDVAQYNFEKGSIIYVLNLYLSSETYKIAKKIHLFKTPMGVFCKIEL